MARRCKRGRIVNDVAATGFARSIGEKSRLQSINDQRSKRVSACKRLFSALFRRSGKTDLRIRAAAQMPSASLTGSSRGKERLFVTPNRSMAQVAVVLQRLRASIKLVFS